MLNYKSRAVITCIAGLFIVALTFCSCGSNKEKNPEKKVVNDTISNELSLLNAAIKANPKEISPYLERAKYYAHHNKFNEALADVNVALDMDKKNPDAFIALSEVYLYSGKTQRALDAVKEARGLAPSDADVDVASARIYLMMSDYKQTFNALREALKKDPQNADAYFIGGLANEEMGDTVKAIDSYQNTVARNSKHYDALKQLGVLFSIKHDPMAIDYLRNAAHVRPKAPEPLYILGMFYQDNNEPDKALSVYQEILQVDSTFKLAHYNTGYVYLVYKQEFDKAIESFNRALKLDPEYVDAMYNRGYAKELSHNYSGARSDYEQVLRMKTNNDNAVKGLNRLDALTK